MSELPSANQEREERPNQFSGCLAERRVNTKGTDLAKVFKSALRCKQHRDRDSNCTVLSGTPEVVGTETAAVTIRHAIAAEWKTTRADQGLDALNSCSLFNFTLISAAFGASGAMARYCWVC